MRKELQAIDQQRMRFRATVEKFGSKTSFKGYPKPTLLLKNIYRVDIGIEVTDHLWLTIGVTIQKLNLQIGNVIEFDARVGDYVKGFVNYREYIDERTVDYKLNRPTRFSKIN